MASLNSEITIKTSEYRPCIVDGKKALFHRWVERSEIISPSLMIGGHGGGCAKWTVAIVEFEDGKTDECLPRQICFVDNLFKEYAFPEEKEQKEKKTENTIKPQKRYEEMRVKCPFCGEGNKNAILVKEISTRKYFAYCNRCKKETKDMYKTIAETMAAFAEDETRKITGAATDE